MTIKCPACGHVHDATDSAPVSNSQREVTLKIPEHHWGIMRMMFMQMNTRFGMMGLGEFANLLPSYDEQIPIDRNIFRYFDDVSLAYYYLALERGYLPKIRTESGGSRDYQGNERLKVIVELTHPDGDKPLRLTLSDGVLPDIARDAITHLEDAASRYAAL